MCVCVEERVKGEGIPMSFEAEKNKGVKECMLSQPCFVHAECFTHAFCLDMDHVLLCLYKHAMYVFSPKLAESSALQGDKGTKLFPY